MVVACSAASSTQVPTGDQSGNDVALAAWFAVTINVQTGQPLIGAILFPVGFCILYLLGFDLLTGVFVLTPLALIDKRPGVTLNGVPTTIVGVIPNPSVAWFGRDLEVIGAAKERADLARRGVGVGR